MITLPEIQQQTCETLERHMGSEKVAAILDFPRHRNAGDSLIWRGSLRYFKKLGITAGYVASLAKFSSQLLRDRVPTGPIVISGGGNFGDLWPEQQRFREQVISELQDRKIVQLPQSINFASGDALRRAQDIFSTHPNLTLLIRESKQLDLTRRSFPNANVEFCFDLALGVGPLPRPASAATDVLFLLRADQESARDQLPAAVGFDFEVSDWSFTHYRDSVRWRAARLPEDVSRVVPKLYPLLYPSVRGGFESIANLNVNSASRLLSRGRVVVTDRLHAMIHAALLSIPVVAIDNSSGKVGSIYSEYVGKLPNVYFAGDLSQAIERAKDLLR